MYYVGVGPATDLRPVMGDCLPLTEGMLGCGLAPTKHWLGKVDQGT